MKSQCKNSKGEKMSVAHAVVGIAKLPIIEKVLNDLYDTGKKIVGDQIKLWKVNNSAKKLRDQIQKIRKVKTLWQVDKAVDLEEFYCDSRLILDGKRVVVHSISDLGNRKHVVITGIAGQGKSILLRYVCGNVIAAGEYLPVFIELRRVSSDKSLMHSIQEFFEEIGIPSLEERLVKILLASGKVVLFLDGFDEVAEKDKQRIINETEHISSIYNELRIIITSRPESGIQVSPLLEVVALSDLKGVQSRL